MTEKETVEHKSTTDFSVGVIIVNGGLSQWADSTLTWELTWTLFCSSECDCFCCIGIIIRTCDKIALSAFASGEGKSAKSSPCHACVSAGENVSLWAFNRSRICKAAIVLSLSKKTTELRRVRLDKIRPRNSVPLLWSHASNLSESPWKGVGIETKTQQSLPSTCIFSSVP